MACERLTEPSAKALLKETDNFLFDCDGVLWDGRGVIPGSLETIIKLKELGKKVFYITNNSSRTREQYLEKCKQYGYPATVEEIVCTAYVAALYLRNISFKDKVYVVGNPAMGKELDQQGIRHTGIGPCPLQGTAADWIDMKLDPEVKCVLVGFDGHLSYMKIMYAATYLQNPECLFVATNEDTHLPVSNSSVRIPGTGTMVAAVKTPAQREPIVVGKPERPMFEELQKLHNLDPARCVMVGDRINSDIGLAKMCGLKSLLVLTGVTAESELPLQDDVSRTGITGKRFEADFSAATELCTSRQPVRDGGLKEFVFLPEF
ncbi:hypothetical protein BaRGS_00017336 [Batillaria attramentaria]|uniref:4-nitrophenylphosphatase n=1 Tax=Batillaria attramentaria TaxID=370345 RepID=A0ABD0KWA2_9CAEN